jgi:hypothetical protein
VGWLDFKDVGLAVDKIARSCAFARYRTGCHSLKMDAVSLFLEDISGKSIFFSMVVFLMFYVIRFSAR